MRVKESQQCKTLIETEHEEALRSPGSESSDAAQPGCLVTTVLTGEVFIQLPSMANVQTLKSCNVTTLQRHNVTTPQHQEERSQE